MGKSDLLISVCAPLFFSEPVPVGCVYVLFVLYCLFWSSLICLKCVTMCVRASVMLLCGGVAVCGLFE